MSPSTLQNDEARPEMDDLLNDYFKAQLPKPWPAFKAPMQARAKRPVSLWSRYSGRLALAACVALLVAGYLTLAGYFPTGQQSHGLQQVTPPIGHKDGGNRTKMPDHSQPMP